jgi:hypothetical protein
MRRSVALARDYAKRRVAFGAPLADKPLHVDTIASLQAEAEAAFHLTFRGVELLGEEETGSLDEEESALLRLMNPLIKLVTGKQGVAVASEALEAFGGAGYVEDTGLPRMLRDAQVLPIWEGTTNVLSLDLLRALARIGTLEPIEREVARRTESCDASLASAAKVAVTAVAHAKAWLVEAQAGGPPVIEAGARRFALTLGRALALALLVDHATWSLAHEKDGRAAAAARRFSRQPIDLIDTLDAADARALANDEPLP